MRLLDPSGAAITRPRTFDRTGGRVARRRCDGARGGGCGAGGRCRSSGRIRATAASRWVSARGAAISRRGTAGVRLARANAISRRSSAGGRLARAFHALMGARQPPRGGERALQRLNITRASSRARPPASGVSTTWGGSRRDWTQASSSGRPGRGGYHRQGGRIGAHRLGHQTPTELAGTGCGTGQRRAGSVVGTRGSPIRLHWLRSGRGSPRTCSLRGFRGRHHERRQAEQASERVDLGVSRTDRLGDRRRFRRGALSRRRRHDRRGFERLGPWPVPDGRPEGGGRQPAGGCRPGAAGEAERTSEAGDRARHVTDAHPRGYRPAGEAEARTDPGGERRAETGRVRRCPWLGIHGG